MTLAVNQQISTWIWHGFIILIVTPQPLQYSGFLGQNLDWSRVKVSLCTGLGFVKEPKTEPWNELEVPCASSSHPLYVVFPILKFEGACTLRAFKGSVSPSWHRGFLNRSMPRSLVETTCDMSCHVSSYPS